MKLSEAIKPISYLKTHASEIVRDVSDNRKTLIITLNGEAKAVLQDVKLYEKTQESLALLKILSISSHELKKGKYKSISKTFKDTRKRIDTFRKKRFEVQD